MNLRLNCRNPNASFSEFEVSSLTSGSSSSSVDSITNGPTLEMSSKSLTSVSENRLTMPGISSITSLQAVATTVNQSNVPLNTLPPDISESQSNISLTSTAVSSLPNTTSEQPSNSSVTTVTQSFRFNSSSTAKSEITPLDGLSTYVTREEGNFSDDGKTLPPVSPVSDSGQQAATTFNVLEYSTMNNDTGPPLQGTTDMIQILLMLKLKIPINVVCMLFLYSSY